jgi:uncharacterized OsmC-like protein
MLYSAHVDNSQGRHIVTVRTGESAKTLTIPPKQEGFGSSINGGELLFLALATCYCNDVYREAARFEVDVQQVEVAVEGEFGAPGEPAQNVHYRVRVTSSAPEEEIRRLLAHTDVIAEIHNTVRAITPVSLQEIEVIAARPPYDPPIEERK